MHPAIGISTLGLNSGRALIFLGLPSQQSEARRNKEAKALLSVLIIFAVAYEDADREVACMAYVRRKFVDIHRSQGSPIAEEAISWIAQLYAVVKEARGFPPDRRTKLRRTHAAPVFDDLERWLAIQLTTISAKIPWTCRGLVPLL